MAESEIRHLVRLAQEAVTYPVRIRPARRTESRWRSANSAAKRPSKLAGSKPGPKSSRS
jgi:hypothetical protein